MQHASSKSASRNKQVATEHNYQKSGNVGAIGRCLLSVNQTDVNSISLFGEKVNINKTKQNMDDDELDLFAIASVTVAARECANKTTKS